MIKPIVKDVFFLGQKSDLATNQDIQTGQDLQDTLKANETRCVGMAANMIGVKKPFHPKRNGWCGYVVTMDGIHYYVAGDTDAVNELSSVKCDVAMVPIGGTYTMNAKDAAKLINQIRPEVVIPTHYGSIVGKSEDADTFRKFVDQAIVVETRL